MREVEILAAVSHRRAWKDMANRVICEVRNDAMVPGKQRVTVKEAYLGEFNRSDGEVMVK